jgi:O-succinylbenzoate synthase
LVFSWILAPGFWLLFFGSRLLSKKRFLERQEMKIARVLIYRYRLPLVRPLKIGAAEIRHREGLILGLGDDTGHIGLGECAPLPGLHAETFSRANDQLDGLRESLPETSVRPETAGLSGLQGLWSEEKPLYPTVGFGLECAVLDLLARRKNQPLHVFFGAKAHARVRLNALLTGSVTEVGKAAAQRVAQGYTSLKLKVGRDAVETDIQKVAAVSRAAGHRARLRIDANRSWSLETALHFAREVGSCPIEYIEEPIKDPEQMEAFSRMTGWPIALDESLAETIAVFPTPGWVRALILKPAVLGSMTTAAALAEGIEREGKQAVISDTFHSALGRSALAALAAARACPETAAGLDTWRYLAQDLCAKAAFRQQGVIALGPDTDLNRQLNFGMLEALS